MIIGIESQRLFRPHKHGMEIVSLEILQQLKKSNTHQYKLFVANDSDVCIENTNNFTVIQLPAKFYPLWEQFSLPKAARKEKCDVLHCTANTAPLKLKVPMVVTIHDIIYLQTFDFTGSAYQNFGNLYRRYIVPAIAKKAVKVITVSEFAKKNIIDSLHIDADKIEVIYNGVNEAFRIINEQYELNHVKAKYQLPDNYLLHFGNTAPRKNTAGVIRAYMASGIKNPLVIAGCNPSFIKRVIKEEDATHIAQQIFCTGYVDQQDLPALYNMAKLFLYPSFNEGFGMPVAEAMACGTPVITSNVTSLPEVAGNAALLINPTKIEEIVQAIYELCKNETHYLSLQKKGVENAKRFSWENAAKQTENIYTQVAK